jgi:hypothetical protein
MFHSGDDDQIMNQASCLRLLSNAGLVYNPLCIFEVRYVSANGSIRWNRRWVNVFITRAGEDGGREDIDDGIWNVDFGPLTLGRLLEQHRRIEDHLGTRKRRLSPMSPDFFLADLPDWSDGRLDGACPARDITAAFSRPPRFATVLPRHPVGGRCSDAATSTAPTRRAG